MRKNIISIFVAFFIVTKPVLAEQIINKKYDRFDVEADRGNNEDGQRTAQNCEKDCYGAVLIKPEDDNQSLIRAWLGSAVLTICLTYLHGLFRDAHAAGGGG